MATQALELEENRSERVYSLDALRGLMMLLGIAIHSSLTYGAMNYGASWPIKDVHNTSPLFDLLVAFIHVFRMPVFMVTSGYFGALLYFKKGSRAMIQNRIKRILLPFAASVLILYPLIFWAFVYSDAAIKGEENAIRKATEAVFSGNFLPFRTAHLWFLYYLFFFSLAGWLLASTFVRMPVLVQKINLLYKKSMQKYWVRLCGTGLIFFFCLYWMGTEYVITNNTFHIVPSVFITYFVFYGIGWMIYQTDLLKELTAYPWAQLLAAMLFFLFRMFYSWTNDASELLLKQILAAIYTPLFTFGFIALFLTYFNYYSKRLSYLMEAAYWVYIIHLPIVVFFTGLLAGASVYVGLKFIGVLFAASAGSFLSYHFFVRSTFIGMLLNGKIHPTKKTRGFQPFR